MVRGTIIKKQINGVSNAFAASGSFFSKIVPDRTIPRPEVMEAILLKYKVVSDSLIPKNGYFLHFVTNAIPAQSGLANAQIT